MRHEDKFLADLKVKCPLLFKEGCLRSGFHLPEGWRPLVSVLCKNIEHHLVHSVPEEIRGEIYLDQLKEKFGMLRIYLNQSTPYIDGAISLAESLSGTICEDCSNPGKLRGGGYIQTLCDEHYKSNKVQKKESLKKYMSEQIQRKNKEALEDASKLNDPGIKVSDEKK